MDIMEIREPIGSVQATEIRELTAAEIDQVDGGFLFAILGAVAAITAVVEAIVVSRITFGSRL